MKFAVPLQLICAARELAPRMASPSSPDGAASCLSADLKRGRAEKSLGPIEKFFKSSPLSMSAQVNHIYEFGEFRMETAERLLLGKEGPIPLTPKAFDTLLILVQQSGHLIEKDDLMQQVWPDTTVEEANLARNVWALRRVLGDDHGKHRYIETVPKRGYRFIAPVKEFPSQSIELLVQRRLRAHIVTTEEESADLSAAQTEAIVHTSAPNPLAQFSALTQAPVARLTSRNRGIAIVGIVCVIIGLGIAAAAIVRRNANRAPTHTAIDSLAVMPFVNASDNPDLEYLSDGITENIINRISLAAHLKMIAHNSVFRYKGKQIDAQKVGHELGVQAILLGRVVQHGDDLSVSAELVNVGDGSHIWGEHYDRKATDLLFLQEDLAKDIANGLRLQFDSEEQTQSRKSCTDNVEAYQLYLKGRYFWNKRTETGLRKGIEYFQQAIEQDPNYALAYAGLADSYIIMANWRYAPPGHSYAKAKAAALRALELDNRLPEALTSLAYTTLLYERDWKTSESRFQQALALNPNYASAHHFYSICLMTSGRQSEALAEITRAQDLDPLSLIITSVHGWIYYQGRNFDRAVYQYTKTLEMDPKYVPALLDLGATYLRKGEYSKAISQFEEAKTAGGETGRILADLAQAYALSGRRSEALGILSQLERPSAPAFVSTWDLALVHTALGNKARAIELLEKAADERVGWIILLGVDPAFDRLQSEPRFAKLKQRVGIPSPSQS